MNDISLNSGISPNAKIGNNCKIFPFVYIEDDVVIGDNCIIFPFVSILNGTRMGSGNKVHQGSVIAALPQDFDFRGEKSLLVIGNNNVIRENVVINRATHSDGRTVIGNNNFLMEGVHISHDTKIGNHCVFGYGTKIAGDCEIADYAIFSTSVIGNAGTRVGRLAMVRAGVTFSKDVPPYIIAGGNPVAYNGVNTVLMTSKEVPQKIQKHIANAYRLVFHGKNSVLDTIQQICDQVPDGEEVQNIVEFLKSTKAGIIAKM